MTSDGRTGHGSFDELEEVRAELEEVKGETGRPDGFDELADALLAVLARLDRLDARLDAVELGIRELKRHG